MNHDAGEYLGLTSPLVGSMQICLDNFRTHKSSGWIHMNITMHFDVFESVRDSFEIVLERLKQNILNALR